MYITEYDEAAAMEKFKKEYLAQGIAQGLSEGDRQRMVSNAKGMYKKGISPETIAEILDTSIKDVKVVLGLENA